MTTVTDSRGMTYSAEAAGNHGFLRAHVVRRGLVHDTRTQYSIVVCNETSADAFADAFVPDAHGERRQTIVQTVVGPNSDFTTSVLLEPVPPGVVPAVNVVLTGGDIHFTLAVPSIPTEPARAETAAAEPEHSRAQASPVFLPVAQPVRAYPPAVPAVRVSRSTTVDAEPVREQSSPPVAPIVLTFTAMLAICGLFVFRPQIGALAVPAKAESEAVVPVSYRATGLGTTDYTVLDPDGRTIAGGPLTPGDGRFEIRLPRSKADAAYLVRLRVGNPLVAAVAEQYVHVPAALPPPSRAARIARTAAPAALPPPEIRSLSLDRASLASGDTLNVYYDVAAAAGSVALVDPATQVAYGREPLSATGHATFTAPHADAERLLTVVLTATRGKSTAESRVGLTLTPLDAAPSPAGITSVPIDQAQVPVAEPANVAPTATTILAPPAVRSGEPIRVEIRAAAVGLELRLLDESGSELARRSIRPGTSTADFTAPLVRVPTRCVFEATYPHGAGSETVVRAITVRP